jgi:hypothetical protein
MKELSEAERDVTLKERLETERDGHLLQMIRRLPIMLEAAALPEGGVDSLHAKERAGLRIDPIGRFAKECLIFGADKRCLTSKLEWAYGRFMRESMMDQLTVNSHWLGILRDRHHLVKTRFGT